MTKLTKQERDKLGDSEFAYPTQRKEPLENANHLRNAIARFNQVEGVTNAERDTALERIQAAAKKFGIELHETSWRQISEKHTHH